MSSAGEKNKAKGKSFCLTYLFLFPLLSVYSDMKAAFAFASARISAKCLNKEHRSRGKDVVISLPRNLLCEHPTTPFPLKNHPIPRVCKQTRLSNEVCRHYYVVVCLWHRCRRHMGWGWFLGRVRGSADFG